VTVTEVKVDSSPRQLCLPFTEWVLYQGTEVLTRWRYPDAQLGEEQNVRGGAFTVDPLWNLGCEEDRLEQDEILLVMPNSDTLSTGIH
jgi:hypothetical protein